jgi:hypothetical protein
MSTKQTRAHRPQPRFETIGAFDAVSAENYGIDSQVDELEFIAGAALGFADAWRNGRSVTLIRKDAERARAGAEIINGVVESSLAASLIDEQGSFPPLEGSEQEQLAEIAADLRHLAMQLNLVVRNFAIGNRSLVFSDGDIARMRVTLNNLPPFIKGLMN